jgi:hypothetical protein
MVMAEVTLQFGEKANGLCVHYWNILNTINNDTQRVSGKFHSINSQKIPNAIIIESSNSVVARSDLNFSETSDLKIDPNNVQNSWISYNSSPFKTAYFISHHDHDSTSKVLEKISDSIQNLTERLDTVKSFQLFVDASDTQIEACVATSAHISDEFSKNERVVFPLGAFAQNDKCIESICAFHADSSPIIPVGWANDSFDINYNCTAASALETLVVGSHGKSLYTSVNSLQFQGSDISGLGVSKDYIQISRNDQSHNSHIYINEPFYILSPITSTAGRKLDFCLGTANGSSAVYHNPEKFKTLLANELIPYANKASLEQVTDLYSLQNAMSF